MRISAIRCLAGLLVSILVGCSADDGSVSPQQSAELVITATQRILNLPTFTSDVIVLSDAHVNGPNGSFRTEVISGADGLVRMMQTTGFLGGVDEQGPWTMDVETGSLNSTTREGLAVIRGHELHMLAMYPEQRSTASELLGIELFGSDSALVVRHSLDTSHKLLAYYSLRDTVPIGFSATWLDPVVTVTLADWTPLGTWRTFRRATFTQGDETFEYYYDLIELDSRAVDTFRRDAAMARTGVR